MVAPVIFKTQWLLSILTWILITKVKGNLEQLEIMKKEEFFGLGTSSSPWFDFHPTNIYEWREGLIAADMMASAWQNDSWGINFHWSRDLVSCFSITFRCNIILLKIFQFGSVINQDICLQNYDSNCLFRPLFQKYLHLTNQKIML